MLCIVVEEFENLVISDKCKTRESVPSITRKFENLVISDKCKTFLLYMTYPA